MDLIRLDIKAGKAKTGEDIRRALKASIVTLLKARTSAGSSELRLTGRPAVVLVVGVNGAGKTTTVGKLAHKLCQEGAKVRQKIAILKVNTVMPY